MLTTVRRAFGLVDAARRRRFLVVVLGAIVVSGLEVVTAALIFVLMQLVLEPGVIPELPVIGRLDAILPTTSYRSLVRVFAALFLVFFILRSAVFLGQQHVQGRIVEHTGVQLTRQVAGGYLRMPYAFHLRRNSAELIRNSFDNVQQVVEGVYSASAVLLSESVLVVALLSVLVIAQPIATAAVAVLMLLAVVVTLRIIQPRIKRYGRERQDAVGETLSAMQQAFGGIRDIAVLGRQEHFVRAIGRGRARMARPAYLRATLAYLPRITIEGTFLGFVVVLLVVATGSGSSDRLLGTLALFAYAGVRLQPSVQKIATALNAIRYADAAVQTLHADVRALPDVGLSSLSAPLRPLRESLVLDQVSFRYDVGGPSALDGVDVAIPAGTTLGIAGRTGGGKSTLLDVLCGLLNPSDGRVLVDGVDLQEVTTAWQAAIGVVHQTPFLIDDTVRANIAFGVDADDLDDDALQMAIGVCDLRAVVRDLPEGLDTVLGERGIRLSGGQRQRIALARAVYRRPSLLILDEGTSALDGATEARVIANLRTLPDRPTLIMVAHRLATIRDCDLILYLDDGRIAAAGTYAELLATEPRFAEMASAVT